MNLIKTAGLAIVSGSLLVACGNADYKKTKEGMAYKIFSDGKGDSIKPGAFIKVYIKNTINDSALADNFGRIPAYGPYDTTRKGNYNFTDFLNEMKVGDSAVFSLSVDSLVNKGMAQYNPIFKKGSTIKGTVKILGTFKDEAEVNKDYEAEMEKEKQREIVALEKHLKEKNINAVKTKSGVFVLIEKEGTGLKADSGMQVKVNYTGTLLNGNKFDSNVDSTFHHTEPLDFVVGTRSVIAGWDEGLKEFKAGGKGKLFVPAALAYGQQSQGEKMPAWSDLVFDIDLLDVKPAPAAPAGGEGAIPQPIH